jgi:hypothetical protein
MSLKDEAKDVLRNRALSYQRVFLKKGVDTDRVLVDLATFCRAHASTFHGVQAISDRLDGRREVWLRIQHHLQLTDDQLWNLYGNKSLPDD